MPHIIVEHTKEICDVPALLNALHHSLAGQETVQINALKTRSVVLDHAVIGDGSTKSMMHITVKLLAGRPDDLLKKMTGDLFDIARHHCDISKTRITVEAMPLHNDIYKN